MKSFLSVPDDLLTKILSRLPVVDLLECRCVVKSWRKLTGTADFLKIHLKHSKEANSNTGHLLRRNSYIYGFRYDPQGDDYKLVRIFGLLKVEDNVISVCLVDIYSLKNKSHRRISNFPYCCAPYKDGILVNNALHWVVHPKKESIASKSILAFDLVSEEYNQVLSLYEDFDYDGTLCLSGTLGGRLCVECWTKSWECMEVWVMEKYGAKESWTRLFSLSNNDCFAPCRTTLTYWKTSDNVLLIDDCEKEYIIYNLKTEMMFGNVKFPFEHRLDLNPKICVQSLVGLNDDDNILLKSSKVVERCNILLRR
ncbi:hypothetical protein UlMin_019661 [Ulmus minor]